MRFSRMLYLSLVCLSLWPLKAAAAISLTNWETYTQGEEQEAADLANDLITMMKKEYADQGKRTLRDAHPRGIGCVAAKFTVAADIAKPHQTGVFAAPGKTYDAIIRFSSSLGPVGDQVKDARGMAIKLFDVPGTKLLEDQPNAQTQDFLLINSPIFPAANTHQFAGLVKLRLNPSYIVKFLAESPIKHALVLKHALDLTQGNPNNGKSLATMQFHSMTTYLLKGDAVNIPVKYTARPCDPVADRPLNGSETELRDDLQDRLDQGSLCYKFGVQFYAQGKGLEIEDPSKEWTEKAAPIVDFATLKIPAQAFRTDQKLRYCDALSFQPWHSIAQHQPLGNINRARKTIYEAISDYRHRHNMEAALYPEPVSLAAWNDLRDPTYNVWKSVKMPATTE